MKKTLIYIVLFLATVTAANAQAPQAFNYQGVARSTSGVPLATQPIGLRISVHDLTVSGTIVYQETFAITTNAFGLYNAAIGEGTVVSGTFAGINWATGNKYLEVEMDPAGGTAYVSVGATQLLSVPYAMYAANSSVTLPNVGTAGTYGSATQVPVFTTDAQGRVTAVTNTPIVMPTVSGTVNYVAKFTSATGVGNSNIFDNGSTVGVNTATPSNMARLHVSGVGTYSVLPYYQAGIVADGGASAGSASGIYGEGGWRGVYGRNPGTATGAEAIGVLGRVEGSSYVGTGYGVKGECAGTGGTANYGVYGTATGTAIGVAGVLTGSGTGAAGKFDGGTSGYGIIVPNGGSGFGTAAPTNMAKMEVSGVGTYSVAPFYQAGIVADGPTTASASGLYGTGGWRGVYGRNPGTSAGFEAIGVLGRLEGSSYTNGFGVKGESIGTGPNSYAVYGTASGTGIGVAGFSTGSGDAGYFSGAVQVTGLLSKGGGSFKIDHPLDPENKYLYHSFVESPDMMNVYNGNITTDASGVATVALPDYFEALNKDFRYQLTTIGQAAQVYISKEVSGNQFEIKSDKPNVKVSWQITGVRQDKFAEAHRIVPEVEKEAQFKGHYIHAAEWGQPDSKSINAVINPKATTENNQ